MEPEPGALEVDGLQVRYGSREVLRGLSLRIEPGEIYGMLGPNGAGKTTLVRAICGRIQMQAGSVRVAGVSGKASLRNVGLAPQELALYPYLTVRENLALFGRMSGLSAASTRSAIAWAGEATAVASRMDDRIDILSGGWKRRVNIAAAILHRPALLILDEPTVGVDIDARNGLHEVIAELSRTGIGVLLATHDLDQAEALCTTVGFLRKGIMAPQGPPSTLLKNEFGSQKELVLELRQIASPRQAEALSKAGFQAIKGGFSWFRYTPAGVQSLEELHEALNQAGIHARETRVREPGLDSLFVKLTRSSEARQ